VDDGIYFYQICNTIGWYNPFYNDYYGQYFHFMKPATLLYAFIYSLTGTIHFRLIALIQSAELLACVYALYACARRFVSETSARAGVLPFLYLLFFHGYLSPTRPETTVLLCTLVVFWMCERFSDTHRVRYLGGACAITCLLAIPMHTNGSIPFIYLALFTVAQRRHLSRGAAIQLAGCALLCALTGAAILLYPHASSFAQSLAMFSYDGTRFSMVKSEYLRMKQFVSDYYHFPLIVLLVSVYCGRLLWGCSALQFTRLKKYRPLFLYALAVFLGLGLLPSATWTVYVVYYFLPLMVGFSAALGFCVSRTGTYYLMPLVLLLPGVLTLWYGYGIMPRLYFLFYALPFFLAAVLTRWVTAVQPLGIIVVPMLVYSMVMMGSSRIIYDRAEHRIKEARGLVLAHPLFNFSGQHVLQVTPCETHSDGGTHFIELQPVARTKAELISAHPLVKYLGPPPALNKESRWVTRRELGEGFLLISNDEWGMPEHIAGQVQPLGYAAVKEVPLSGTLLDRFANPSMKGLRCIEYRYAGPTP
jgi:hypothetical protein